MDGFHYPPVGDADLRSGCYLTSIGSLCYQPGQRYPVPGHPARFDFRWEKGRAVADHAFILITAGEGEFEAAGVPRLVVRGGDILYLVPGQWHRYRPRRSKGWSEKWVCLNGEVPHRLRDSGWLPSACFWLGGAATPGLAARLDRLLETVACEPGCNRPSWGMRALSMVLEAFEGCAGLGGGGVPAPDACGDAVVEEGLRFIGGNCHRPIRVSDVARECRVGRRTLERRFAAASADPVGQAIVRARIGRAEHMLAHTRLPVKEIAYACGFVSPQRMIYDFRRHRGRTPGAIRAAGSS